jgi:hypothetical protein
MELPSSLCGTVLDLAVNPNKSQAYSKGQVIVDPHARDLFEGRGFEIVPPSKGIIVAGAQLVLLVSFRAFIFN